MPGHTTPPSCCCPRGLCGAEKRYLLRRPGYGFIPHAAKSTLQRHFAAPVVPSNQREEGTVLIATSGSTGWDGVDRWSEALAEWHGRIARRFARVEVRERVRRYLLGLLGRVERTNGWQLAEAIGEAAPLHDPPDAASPSSANYFVKR